jgi:hypothetical protein
MQGNNVSIQVGSSAAASMDMTPLIQAFENMVSSVPQLQQLFQAQPVAQAARQAPAPAWAAQPSTAATAQAAGEQQPCPGVSHVLAWLRLLHDSLLKYKRLQYALTEQSIQCATATLVLCA